MKFSYLTWNNFVVWSYPMIIPRCQQHNLFISISNVIKAMLVLKMFPNVFFFNLHKITVAADERSQISCFQVKNFGFNGFGCKPTVLLKADIFIARIAMIRIFAGVVPDMVNPVLYGKVFTFSAKEEHCCHVLATICSVKDRRIRADPDHFHHFWWESRFKNFLIFVGSFQMRHHPFDVFPANQTDLIRETEKRI